MVDERTAFFAELESLKAERDALRLRVAELEGALIHIGKQSECRCPIDYTGRGRHAPECQREIYLTAEEALRAIADEPEKGST